MMISIIPATLVTCALCPAPFKLSVTGQIHTHLWFNLFFFILIYLFVQSGGLIFSLSPFARQQHPNGGRCWKDIKPAVLCFQAGGASRLISRRNLADGGRMFA
ncbi:hypothetical protein GOODEAATRI_027468 [Goodea atripinnis]|uniref:Uncharacterized protein n=1 Tax=Goodea atripinnis TaxID=208336 RepID=A0ABV0PHV5_9TELE